MLRQENKVRLHKLTSISLILGLMFVFSACGDDPITPKSSEVTFANSPNAKRMGDTSKASYGNVVTMGSIQAVNEGSIDLRQVACRMEIPRLRGGDRNLFIVHTVPTYGVNYCVEWSYDQKAQYWSAFRWDKSNTGGSAGYTGNFRGDPLIPTAYRTTNEDHKNGYNRGHMVASADRQKSYDANDQTFYLSNMQPQLWEFNSNDGKSNWYNLEIGIRNKYNKDGFRDTLYVVKGGTIDSGNCTYANGLPVPKYFFMAILAKKNSNPSLGGYKAIGFWMKHEANTDTNYKNYAVSIDELEQKTGIDFFCNLPDDIEAEVEKSLVLDLWK